MCGSGTRSTAGLESGATFQVEIAMASVLGDAGLSLAREDEWRFGGFMLVGDGLG